MTTPITWEPGPEAGPLPTELAASAPGEAGLASRRLHIARAGRFELFSNAFRDGSPVKVPRRGEPSSPPLHWHSFLPEPESFVLICEDRDAPGAAPFVHWLVYGIPGYCLDIDGNVESFREGINGRGALGYTPPAPPAGTGVHHYHFQLFALDAELELDEGADVEELLEAMVGHVIAWGELIGTSERT